MVDKTVKINVDNSEVNRAQATLRQDTEQLARDMIRSARQYSTSSKEVLKDINDQIKAIEKRNKLDAEFRRQRVESLRERGGLTDAQYANQKNQIGRESRQDELQTRLLREIIDTIKHTSKDEIREDRRRVEQVIQSSKTVGRLGVKGDELAALKETVQQDIIGGLRAEEAGQTGRFNLGRYSRVATSMGGAAARGDLSGAAMAGGRGLLSAAGGMGGEAALGLGAGGLVLGIMAAVLMGDKLVMQRARDYAIATQTGGASLFRARDRFGRGMNFQEMGMSTFDAMNFNAMLAKATGGRNIGIEETRGLVGLTRSRAVSPELLGQTLGFQRYSNTGNDTTVVTAFEKALKRLYPDEFRRKLIQLPEMMGVYNSLAQQMLQTTGAVNTQALANFVSGVSEGFGVQGVNLQRLSTGFLRGFSSSHNNYIRKLQFSSLRKAYGNISYQESLERLQDPTASPEYMRIMAATMQRQGLPQFRAWMQSMGLGAREAGEYYKTGNFDKMIASMEAGKSKTAPDQKEVLNMYFKEAQQYYSKTEVMGDKIVEFMTNLLSKFGVSIEDDVTNGVIKANHYVQAPMAMKSFDPNAWKRK